MKRTMLRTMQAFRIETLIPQEDPPPCNSGIIGILEDSNVVLSIPYSHYYRVGGPPSSFLAKH